MAVHLVDSVGTALETILFRGGWRLGLLWVVLVSVLTLALWCLSQARTSHVWLLAERLLPVRGRWLWFLVSSLMLVLLAPTVGILAGAYTFPRLLELAYSWLEPLSMEHLAFGLVRNAAFGWGAGIGLAAVETACLLALRLRLLAGWFSTLSGVGLSAIVVSWWLAWSRDPGQLVRGLCGLPGAGAPLVWAALLVVCGAT